MNKPVPEQSSSLICAIAKLPTPLRRRLVPVGIFLVSVLLAEAVGFEMRIPWSHYQVLDRQVLEATPFGALLLLHSQPPMMNALLALGYNEREALGATKMLVPDVSVSDGIRAALKLLSKSS